MSREINYKRFILVNTVLTSALGIERKYFGEVRAKDCSDSPTPSEVQRNIRGTPKTKNATSIMKWRFFMKLTFYLPDDLSGINLIIPMASNNLMNG